MNSRRDNGMSWIRVIDLLETHLKCIPFLWMGSGILALLGHVVHSYRALFQSFGQYLSFFREVLNPVLLDAESPRCTVYVSSCANRKFWSAL